MMQIYRMLIWNTTHCCSLIAGVMKYVVVFYFYMQFTHCFCLASRSIVILRNIRRIVVGLENFPGNVTHIAGVNNLFSLLNFCS